MVKSELCCEKQLQFNTIYSTVFRQRSVSLPVIRLSGQELNRNNGVKNINVLCRKNVGNVSLSLSNVSLTGSLAEEVTSPKECVACLSTSM